MRHSKLMATLAVAVAAIVGCQQETPDRTLTAPDGSPLYARALGGRCDAARLRAITTQQADLWAKPKLDSAQAHFAPVISDCNADVGRNEMLSYIQWTIDNRASIITQRTGTPESNLLAHWNTVFPYVGYTGSDQPSTVPLTIFTDSGAAKVIKWDVGGEITATNAALTQFVQDSAGDKRDHLFVIYPISAGCLSGNLRQFGPCFEFSAYPHLPTNGRFSPKNKIGICEVHSTSDSIAAHITTPALGHLDPLTRITERLTTHYPSFCGDVSSIPAGSWHQGFGGVVKRLAWLTKSALTPEPAYAVHGGLGGFGGGLSPHGAVDLEVFHATFTNNTVGAAPSAPETGTWSTIFATPPGSITVQNSLGQDTSRLVVLQQSGGNCKNCGGLLLQGKLATTGPAAAIGLYEVEFDALQAQSNMKEAVFALRDSVGRDLARVTFAVRNNVNLILYNDTKGSPGTILGNWVQYQPRHFRIQVDLDNQSTTIWFNGAATAAVSGAPYVNTKANSFYTISADFTGIDSGTMGWDEIKVTRLSDSN